MKVRIIRIGPKAKKILYTSGAYNEFSKNILNRDFESFDDIQRKLNDLKIYRPMIIFPIAGRYITLTGETIFLTTGASC